MNRYVVVAGVAAAQLALTAVAVVPQLSARLGGDTYLVRVAPVDPIDPFRGAYVSLDYPDLWPADSPRDDGWESGTDAVPGDGNTIYVVLEQDGALTVASDWTRTRPASSPYLACRDQGFSIRCGIESWFAPQDEARRLEETLREDGAVAELRVDDRGNAAIVDLRAAP
ncbi:GDYXXLXY domain-containing protein [Nocardioides solisilvae]|uniref:GDYXXLXY domain-containing protein n=1 Tax=Nocardioides solisilvae TaxID=1542435 RepID=UPI000D74DA60|nr:GDYXXLXY domain-containing protein [Nocardioides solisilvae]